MKASYKTLFSLGLATTLLGACASHDAPPTAPAAEHAEADEAAPPKERATLRPPKPRPRTLKARARTDTAP